MGAAAAAAVADLPTFSTGLSRRSEGVQYYRGIRDCSKKNRALWKRVCMLLPGIVEYRYAMVCSSICWVSNIRVGVRVKKLLVCPENVKRIITGDHSK